VRRCILALGLWVCPGSAWAELPISAEVVGSSTLVPTLWAPGATTETLTGSVEHGGVFDPSLRFGLFGTVVASLPASSSLVASYGVWREQTFCDVCEDGQGPGSLGSELLGSTDLTVALVHAEPLGEAPEDGGASGVLRDRGRSSAALVLRADVVLPASRDALSCNVMYGAPGLGATFRLPVGGSTVGVGVSARRPFYRYDAAPVGRCAPPLRGTDTVETLTGAVSPTPWNGDWFGASNPSLSGSATVSWAQVHAVVPRAPTRLRSSMSLGLAFQRYPVDPPVVVDTLTGPVTIAPSSRPLRTQVPWSLEGGYGLTDSLDLTLSLSNRVPFVLADPGGTFRALPASTAVTAAAAAQF
jgi:hypothetical protein